MWQKHVFFSLICSNPSALSCNRLYGVPVTLTYSISQHHSFAHRTDGHQGSLYSCWSKLSPIEINGLVTWQLSIVNEASVKVIYLITVFYFISLVVFLSVTHWVISLQCCEKGTSSSTKGSKSWRWDIIYWTVSCRSRRWPREWPSNWSPRALNRQFLQEIKTVTGMSTQPLVKWLWLLRFLARMKVMLCLNQRLIFHWCIH